MSYNSFMKYLLFIAISFSTLFVKAQTNIKYVIDTTTTDSTIIIKERFQVFDKFQFLEDEKANVKVYYKDYKLKESYSYKLGDIIFGNYFTYYRNGQLNEFLYFKDGLITGIYSKFYENGKKEIIGEFEEIQCSYDVKENCDTLIEPDPITGLNIITCVYYTKSIQCGTWQYFDINGILKKEEYWNKNILIKTVNY